MSVYGDELRRYQADYFLRIVAENGCNMGRAAKAIGVHRNTISRVLRNAGYPSRRIKKIIRQQLAAIGRKPVQSVGIASIEERKSA